MFYFYRFNVFNQKICNNCYFCFMESNNEIKNHFIESGEKDKFAKSQKFESKNYINFSTDGGYNETVTAYLSYVAMDSNDSDALVFELNYTARGAGFDLLSGASGILTNGIIQFLLDDDETIRLDNILEHVPNNEMLGSVTQRYNEKLYLISDIATLIKLASSTKIEFKISANGLGDSYVGELENSGLMLFKGFYNGLFDPEFMKDNLLNYIKERNEIKDRYDAEEAERLEALEKKKQNDILEEQKAKQREEDYKKQQKTIKYVFIIIAVIVIIYSLNS